MTFRKPEFTFVIQRISSNDSSGQETIAESSCGGSTMATTTDRLLYKPDEIMHAFVPIFFSWEIFSFSPTVNCNAVGQYKMLTKGDLLGSFCSFSTPPNPLLSNTHYICRQRMHNLIWSVECSIHCTSTVLHMLLLSAIASCPEESLEEILCITNVYCGFP